LVQVAKTGGSPRVVWSGSDSMQIAANRTAVFVALVNSTVQRVAKPNGVSTTIGHATVVAIGADDTAVYVAGEGLTRWPSAGGNPVAMVDGSLNAVAVQRDRVVVSRPVSMRQVGDDLVPNSDGAIVIVPVGGDAIVVADHQTPSNVAIDGDDI